jgi:hypothetical protein
MSLANTAPAAEAAGATRRPSLLRWIAGGTSVATALTVVAIAVWPASAADKAYENGEQFGQAVGSLYYADSSTEVDAALAEIDAAIADTRADAGDEVADQAAAQEAALARAANGFVGSVTTDDAWEAELYEAELDIAVADLTSNASDFRAQGPEVHEAFWQGVDDGLPSS